MEETQKIWKLEEWKMPFIEGTKMFLFTTFIFFLVGLIVLPIVLTFGKETNLGWLLLYLPIGWILCILLNKFFSDC